MTVTTRISAALLLGCLTATVQGEELQWRPVPAAATPSPSSMVHLGAPVPLSQMQPVSGQDSSPCEAVTTSNSPWPAGWTVRGQAPGGVPTVPPPALPPGKAVAGEEGYNCGVPGTTAPAPGGGPFGGFMQCVTNPTGGRKCLESDHCFDTFISPVTAPNTFEDPRALTEFRPVFTFQQTKNSNPIFNGGDIENLNFRGSVALTDWFSITFDQLGWIWVQPRHSTMDFHSQNGFTELQLGPKFTFYRNTTGGPTFGPGVAAAGLVFEIPIGSRDVFQDTGWLSLRPYITYGQEFLGAFHLITEAAYSVAVDSERSDHLFLGLHLDYDVAKLHKIYPFIELDYYLYTSNGHFSDFNFEGANLINFGSEHVAGQSELDLAIGARYKCNEHIQFGGAFVFGLVGSRDTQSFGFILDMIFRY